MSFLSSCDKIIISSYLQARPAPTSVVWSRAEEPEFRQLGRFLTLKNVTHDEAGLYTCTVTNTVSPSGEVARERVGSAAVRVEVRHPPGEAFIEPEEPVGIEGKSVELRWTAFSCKI